VVTAQTELNCCSPATARATCAANRLLIGGGARITDATDLLDSYPESVGLGGTWVATAAPHIGLSAQVVSYAICSP
jgi:hypothetical protein